MATIERPAFYALQAGGWRDYVNLLHVPYTIWHLSYVAIGAALAPDFSIALLGWLLLAFFLATGLSAHALDELAGRPLQTTIPAWVMAGLAVLPLTVAASMGIRFALDVRWFWPFVIVGPFFVGAYNLEWFGGRLHNRFWFAAAWGAFPAAVGFAANTHTPTVGAMVTMGWIALTAAALSDAQRIVSLRARFVRRSVRTLRSAFVTSPSAADTSTQTFEKEWVLEPLDGALKRLSYAVPLLAAAVVLSRHAG